MSQQYMNPNDDKIRQVAFSCANRLYKIGINRVKRNITRQIFDFFIRPKMQKLIFEEVTINEIKQVMWDCKKEIDPLFKQFDTLEQLKDTKLNDTKVIEKLMKLPSFRELSELLD